LLACGPLGVSLKRKLVNLWWSMFVDGRDDMYGVDTTIIMNPKVWKASGHLETFSDPITFCGNCKAQHRVDKLVDEKHYKAYIDDVLVGFLKEQEELYKSKVSLTKELDESNSELSAIVEDDFKQWGALNSSGAKPETYSHWLEGAQSRINSFTETAHLVGTEYSKLTTYLDVLTHLQNRIHEAQQYTGRYAKQYLDTFIECPNCKSESWSVPVRFNLMFRTNVGPIDDEESIAYLRPETAQGMFTNYKNILDSFYPDLPFGIAQEGRTFRNEISPRDFIFRAREFEIMELEYFVHPKEWEKSFEIWRDQALVWFKSIGLSEDKIKIIDVPEEDRAHYSERTIDFHYDFPSLGYDEMAGLAYRTDFDLNSHQSKSGKNLEYRPKTGEKGFLPHVIEPTFGVDRNMMAVLAAAYDEDEIGGEKRIVLKLPAHLAPVKVAVSPLLKNKPELVKKAREVYDMLKKEFGNVMYDDNGNIGKRYRRQDEIGTPYCVTIDFDTLEDDTVTVRNRDTTEQERVKTAELIPKVS
jgi:glycyl-tRNA synthetase